MHCVCKCLGPLEPMYRTNGFAFLSFPLIVSCLNLFLTQIHWLVVSRHGQRHDIQARGRGEQVRDDAAEHGALGQALVSLRHLRCVRVSARSQARSTSERTRARPAPPRDRAKPRQQRSLDDTIQHETIDRSRRLYMLCSILCVFFFTRYDVLLCLLFEKVEIFIFNV